MRRGKRGEERGGWDEQRESLNVPLSVSHWRSVRHVSGPFKADPSWWTKRGQIRDTESLNILTCVEKQSQQGLRLRASSPRAGNDNFPRTLDRLAWAISQTQCQGVELRLCGMWPKSFSPLTMGWGGWQELRLKANSGVGSGGAHLQPQTMEGCYSPIASLRKTCVP